MENRVQCTKCPDGSILGQSATGAWRCSQSGLPSSAPAIRSRALRDRTYKSSFCPEGAFSDPDGGCRACGDVATPASIAAGAPQAGPFYDENADVEYYAIVFDSAIAGTTGPLCVPEVCCTSSAGEYTGEGDQLVDDGSSSTDDTPLKTTESETHLQSGANSPGLPSVLNEGRR